PRAGAGRGWRVLVAHDWAGNEPELPGIAVGITVAPTFPPRPPLASARAIELPPTARPVAEPPTPAVTSDTVPPLPETAWAVPPAPPSPPTTWMLVTLTALPVLPEIAVAWALAPVLATEMAPPTALASP